MTRYIDADKVEEIMRKYRCSDCTNEKSLDCPLCQLHRPFDEIGKIPTADVVPKSEVEALKHEIERIIDEGEYWQGKFLNARSTVASEVFEEIGKLTYRLLNDNHYIVGDMIWDIIELKKKYTESEGKE